MPRLRKMVTSTDREMAKLVAAYRSDPDRVVACTHCDHEGPVEPDFGFTTKGVVNSWCRRCRSSPCGQSKKKWSPSMLDAKGRCPHGRRYFNGKWLKE